MADTGTPSGEAFGMQAPASGTDDPLSDDFQLEAPAEPQTPEAPAATPEAPEADPLEDTPPASTETTETPETPETPEAPADGTPQPQAGETPEEAEARKFAGRYQSVEDLEAGYKNIQRLQSRTAQELRDKEQQLLQMQAYLAAQQQARPNQQIAPQETFDASDPRQLQALIDDRVAKETARATQTVQQQALAATVNQAIDQFRQERPDVVQGSPIDEQMAQIVLEFQRNADGRISHDLFPVTVDNLNVAYELAQDARLHNAVVELDLVPNRENLEIAKEALGSEDFYQELLAEPHLLDTPAGLAVARKRAALPPIVSNAQARAAGPTPEEARKKAFVETGGSGAPTSGAPGNRPRDEMDEAISEWNQARDSSIFLR